MSIETLALDIALLSNEDLAELADVLVAQFKTRADKLEWNLGVSIIDQALRGIKETA